MPNLIQQSIFPSNLSSEVSLIGSAEFCILDNGEKLAADIAPLQILYALKVVAYANTADWSSYTDTSYTLRNFYFIPQYKFIVWPSSPTPHTLPIYNFCDVILTMNSLTKPQSTRICKSMRHFFQNNDFRLTKPKLQGRHVAVCWFGCLAHSNLFALFGQQTFIKQIYFTEVLDDDDDNDDDDISKECVVG